MVENMKYVRYLWHSKGYPMYNRQGYSCEIGCVMADVRCQACGTAVMTQAMYCSSCGQLHKRMPLDWVRRSWDGVRVLIRVLVLIWVCGFIIRAVVPVALSISPACGAQYHTIALIPRTVGVIESQQGLVGGQALLQAGDCNQPVSAWYTTTTTQDILFAIAQRDPQTWSGWLVATSEKNISTVTQIGVRGMRDAINLVWRGYQWVVDNCIGVFC